MSDATKFEFDPVPLGGLPNRTFGDLSTTGLLPPRPAEPVLPRVAVKPPEPIAPLKEIVIDNPAKPALPSKMAWVPEAMKALVRPTKSKGVMVAGLASLACGVGVANYMWPAPKPAEAAKVEPAPLPVLAAPTKVEAAAKLEEPVKISLQEPVKITAPEPIQIPAREPVKLPPPTITADTKPALLNLSLPALPDGNVTPAKAEAPAVPGLIIPEAKVPATVTVPPPTITSSVPAIPDVKLPEMKTPDVKLPEMKLPEMQIPGVPVVTAAPVPTTKLPELPAVVLPTAEPKLEVKPVVVAQPQAIGSPAAKPAPQPDVFVPTGQAKPEMSKPEPMKLEPVRTVSALSPREDFDVDVHYPQSGETWLTISKAHLGDERYADALRAYNSGRALAANQPVDVPPMHVLRRQFAGQIPSAKPVTIETPKPSGGARMYEVPREGQSLKEIARKAFGDENYWGQVWEMNPKLRADEIVPGGTRVQLPADAKIGE